MVVGGVFVLKLVPILTRHQEIESVGGAVAAPSWFGQGNPAPTFRSKCKNVKPGTKDSPTSFVWLRPSSLNPNKKINLVEICVNLWFQGFGQDRHAIAKLVALGAHLS